MLAAVSMVDAQISRTTASSVVCGFVWPYFFARNTSICRRPAMILHSVRASHMTCLLLCVSPLMALSPHFDLPRRTLLMMFVLQPAVKVFAVLLLHAIDNSRSALVFFSQDPAAALRARAFRG